MKELSTVSAEGERAGLRNIRSTGGGETGRTSPVGLQGWLNVLVAAMLMTATLPGRTIGLGLITEPLLADVELNRITFAALNSLAVVLGALCCLPCGRWIDRFGVRVVGFVTVMALGASVLGMSRVGSLLGVGVSLVLLRGLGESSLSVIAIAMVGKWFRRRLSMAMGLFAVLMAISFAAAIISLGDAVKAAGWRAAWSQLGWALVAIVGPITIIVSRSWPSAAQTAAESLGHSTANEVPTRQDFTFRQTVTTPAFWLFLLAAPTFNLVFSAVSLFNESLAAERGFDQATAQTAIALVFGLGVLFNLVGGWLGTKVSPRTILVLTMLPLAVSLAAFPLVQTKTHLMLYASGVGASAGLITVLFFSVWGQLFGQSHLGKIQGAAQAASVLGSAAGPWLLEVCRAQTGSSDLFFVAAAPLMVVLAVAAWLTPIPRQADFASA